MNLSFKIVSKNTVFNYHKNIVVLKKIPLLSQCPLSLAVVD